MQDQRLHPQQAIRVLPGLLMAVWLFGCEAGTVVSPPYEPMLQVDAVFVAGEPLPRIDVRRTFAVGEERVVFEEERWARGASVRVHHNGTEVAIEEVAPGRFQPEGERIGRGDVFSIDVAWQDLRAHARAVVPEGRLDGVAFTPSRPVRLDDLVLRNVETGARDTVAVFAIACTYEDRSPATIAFIQIATPSELALEDTYGNTYGITPRYAPQQYVPWNSEESAGRALAVDAVAYAFVPIDELSDADSVSVHAVRVVPEPIYAEYLFTASDALTPVTVTNVDGGVGLFVGAVRDTFLVSLPISL